MATHTDNVYDLCIVGAGMIGSAAARHATLFPNVKVCLIGPSEPKERSLGDDRSIYGAWYDEGRIAKRLDGLKTWATLKRRSIRRYKDIENRTGIQFFSDVGCLTMGERGTQYVKNTARTIEPGEPEVKRCNGSAICDMFPFLNLQDSTECIYESTYAGHISARKLLTAQQTAAHLQGCEIIDDVVSQVTSISQSDIGSFVKVLTENGHVIIARKVLLATGAFTAFRNLLPSGIDLDVTLTGITVLKLEVSTQEAHRLRIMPSILYSTSASETGTSTTRSHGFYILPPILYPNGKYYVKIGHGRDRAVVLNTEEEVKRWYCSPPSPSQQLGRHLQDFLCTLIKDLKPISVHTDTGVIVRTPSDNLYLDMVTPNMGVAVGDCGCSAQCSDEIGRIAAWMVLRDVWSSNLPREAFKIQTKDTKKASKI